MTTENIKNTKIIEFVVPAVPVAQPRSQPGVMKSGKAFMKDVKSSHPVHDFKASVRSAFSAEYCGPPTDEAVELELVFVMPRPSNKIWKTRAMPREPYISKKNDWDNLGKSVCDALNKIAWTDDGRIWRVHVERWTASGHEQPQVKVRITKETPWKQTARPF